MLALLRQLHLRAVVVAAGSMLAFAGMAALVVWLDTVPPRDQLVHVTGQLQQWTLHQTSGSLEMTLLSEGASQTFDVSTRRRPVNMSAWTRAVRSRQGDKTVALAYFQYGRGKQVVAIVLGSVEVLSYDEVARAASQKASADRNIAIGSAVMGALLMSLAGLARLARASAPQAAPANLHTTAAALLWLMFYGMTLVAILSDRAILHRAFGAEAFHLPIEYVVPAALALLFLPWWPGFMGLASTLGQAMRKGRGGALGIVLEMGSALTSDGPGERRVAIKTLWFFVYFALLVAAWIAYAEKIGI